MKKPKKKREALFVRILNRLLKLPYLKLVELSIGFVKGFSAKIEFFEEKDRITNQHTTIIKKGRK